MRFIKNNLLFKIVIPITIKKMITKLGPWKNGFKILWISLELWACYIKLRKIINRLSQCLIISKARDLITA